ILFCNILVDWKFYCIILNNVMVVFIEDIQLLKKYKEELELFTKDIPIRWDRVIESEYHIIFYGWIGNDFVHILYIFDDDNEFAVIYSTSSIKYSKKLDKNIQLTLTGKYDTNGHKDRIKFADYFKGID
ncbi:MAG: hypothetical protein ACFFG0_54555, partial [Candidatus Thorarchaeota archaeon]